MLQQNMHSTFWHYCSQTEEQKCNIKQQQCWWQYTSMTICGTKRKDQKLSRQQSISPQKREERRWIRNQNKEEENVGWIYDRWKRKWKQKWKWIFIFRRQRGIILTVNFIFLGKLFCCFLLNYICFTFNLQCSFHLWMKQAARSYLAGFK